jgi:subtilisin family serine protease
MLIDMSECEIASYCFSVNLLISFSMASPHVAGAAALLLSHFPSCTATQITYALAFTAKDNGTKGCDDQYGYGIVQVKAAYDFLLAYRCSPNTNWGKTVGDGTCSAVDAKPFSF